MGSAHRRIRRYDRFLSGWVRGALVGLVALALFAPCASARNFTNDDYWQFADAEAAAVEPFWNSSLHLYGTKQTGIDAKFNSAMLMLFSGAAIANRQSPSRADARAVAIADAFTKYPAFLTVGDKLGVKDPQAHLPGWHATMSDDANKNQHIAVDAQVARALAVAWLAGPVMGMSTELRARIAKCIKEVADSTFFYGRRLNQVNWPADLYASAVATGADKSFLTIKYRRQLIWLARHAKPTKSGRSGNFTGAFGLRYDPLQSTAFPLNVVTSTEYGNIVASAFTHLPQARLVGMQPLPKDVAVTLGRFQLHELLGDWTSSGYPNWDSGFGLNRTFLNRYWAHAQGTLIPFAKGTGLELYPQEAAWAKSVLDNGFELYARWSEGTGLLPVRPFGLAGQASRDSADPALDAARMGANAALAVLEGLGRKPGIPMPAVFTRDKDVDRLAISTPVYSTAVVRRSNAGYGGIEPARLLGPSSQVLGTLGGKGEDAFGLRVLGGGHTILDTQPGTTVGVRALSGIGGGDSVAGTFSSLGMTASGSAPKVKVGVRDVFTRDRIVITHEISNHKPGRIIELTFPAPRGADWSRVVGAAHQPVPRSGPLSSSASFVMRGRDGGYDLVLRRLPSGTSYKLVQALAQQTDPKPGVTLVVIFPAGVKPFSVSTAISPRPITPPPVVTAPPVAAPAP
jgi:hypothetical protein